MTDKGRETNDSAQTPESEQHSGCPCASADPLAGSSAEGGVSIERRDFLNGVALAVGAALLPRPAAALVAEESAGWPTLKVPGQPPLGKGADLSAEAPLAARNLTPADAGYYPPVLTGMRGNHPGSFEVPHRVRKGAFKQPGASSTRETYDLVVVGGGISGLAAAYRFRARAGRKARILILDNHDDFGGHAKRNELHVDGRMLLMNGGTMSIHSPFPYSHQAAGLLSELGVDPPALNAKCVDRDLYPGLGLKSAVFFDKETFGADKLVVGEPGSYRGDGSADAWRNFLNGSPLAPEVQKDIVRLQTAMVDYMPGLSEPQKKRRLEHMSYKDFLLKFVKVNPGVIPFFQTRTWGLYGVGIDAVGAAECWALGFPGFEGMGLQRVPTPGLSFTAEGTMTPQEPYHFHYPDGNASIARLLVRSLIPGIAPGHTGEDIVTARFNYAKLDGDGSPVRIRLNSPVIRVKHVGAAADAKAVEITYINGSHTGQTASVRASAVVLACYNAMIPFLCPELPSRQKEALRYGVKVPLIYTTVALRNWQAWKNLGISGVSAPGMYHVSARLNQAINIGEFQSPSRPEEPMLVHMLRTPCKPGLSVRDQQRAGRFELFSTPFATFEESIRDQLTRILGPGGFKADRDIAAIAVNRWSHGYAYEYNALWDPAFAPGESPCEIARQRFGRIAIANSDAAAAAYTDQAIDQGYRAVDEVLALERPTAARA